MSLPMIQEQFRYSKYQKSAYCIVLTTYQHQLVSFLISPSMCAPQVGQIAMFEMNFDLTWHTLQVPHIQLLISLFGPKNSHLPCLTSATSAAGSFRTISNVDPGRTSARLVSSYPRFFKSCALSMYSFILTHPISISAIRSATEMSCSFANSTMRNFAGLKSS